MDASPTTYRVALVGDVHGHMHRMCALLGRYERQRGQRLDLVLQVGDFEPHRHDEDLRSMSAPSKYKRLGDFQDFACGRSRFPWPLAFIGGNHEPYGWLETLPSGGELVDNCHYIGRSALWTFGQLRVLGLSGIHEPSRFETPRPPAHLMPYRSNKDYIYCTQGDVEAALDVEGPVDVLLGHDWPEGIAPAHARLRHPELNPYSRMLIEMHRPSLACFGHMHQRHAAAIEHPCGRVTQVLCLAHIQDGREAFEVVEIPVSR